MRTLTCSECSGAATYGSSRVMSKLLFHFCANCWSQHRSNCEAFMRRVCGIA